MLIKKGTLLNVTHSRKGKFIGRADEDFDTENDEFYSIFVAHGEGVKGNDGEIKWEQGDNVPCRASLCKITIAETHSQ